MTGSVYVYDTLKAQHSHSSIKAPTAGVDESSDHSVEDEGQDLRCKRKEARNSLRLLISLLILLLPQGVCVFLCFVCLLPAEADCL